MENESATSEQTHCDLESNVRYCWLADEDEEIDQESYEDDWIVIALPKEAALALFSMVWSHFIETKTDFLKCSKLCNYSNNWQYTAISNIAIPIIAIPKKPIEIYWSALV